MNFKTNRETRLWYISDPKAEEPEQILLNGSALRLLQFQKDVYTTGAWQCGFCGVWNKNFVTCCEGCQGPNWSRVRSGRATVSAYWDDALFLENQAGGFGLEVLHARAGRPDDYWNGCILAKLWNCIIVRKWIRNLTIQDADAAWLTMNFRIQCSFVLFSGDEERERVLVA